MIRPTDTFLYPLDENDKGETAPAIVCRYGTMGFWMDYDAKLRAAWPDNEAPNMAELVALADAVACGRKNLPDSPSLAAVLTQEQLIGFALSVQTAARLSEVMRKKSERQSQSPSASSAAAVGESA